MDEIVARAMQKWPNVPAVFGWLRLDRRGHWWVKSGGTQGVPAFERIGNSAVAAFIGRNYAPDERGRWFFQNGPQRVFVRLDYLPLVYRLEGAALVAHTGVAAGEARAAWLDEQGSLVLDTALGAGLLSDRDLPQAANAFADAAGAPIDDDPFLNAQRGTLRLALDGVSLPVQPLLAADAPARFGFDPSPAPPPGQPDC
jgi:hypothetical protein